MTMAGATFNFGDMFGSARSVVGQTLVDIGKSNPETVVMTADLGRTNEVGAFQEEFPNRFFNAGIAEQNMFGMAAGLALEGKMPFVCTMSTFASLRACEQFRTDICYQNLKVRVIANNAGLTCGGGPTHYGQEDMAVVRSFANLMVVTPGDPNMFRDVLLATLDYDGPVYIRMAQGKGEPIVYNEPVADFKLGKAIVTREGIDATVIACGVVVSHALEAAKMLEKEGKSVRVLDMHTIKPIDADAILAAARETGKIVTVEDHYTIGGLGSAVAEVLADAGVACSFRRLGIPQVYAGFGSPAALYAKYGYDYNGIAGALREIV